MHLAYLETLLDELAKRDIHADKLVDPIPQSVSAAALAGYLLKAARLVDEPALGLEFGNRLNLASHGMLGYALMSSQNGDQLLHGLTRFARLAIPQLSLQRYEVNQQLHLVCRLDVGVAHREYFVEIVLASLVSGARSLFNRRVPGAEVWLDYPAPDHSEAYKLMGVPYFFNQSYCALVCDRAFLEMKLPSANPMLAEIGNRRCHELLATMQLRSGIASEVRTLLLRSVGIFPDQAKIARLLNVSTRTLRRRLSEEQTAYRDIVDEVRFELARRFLATRELPVTEIAVLLGYEDPANFRRAFKRWSGMTAQAWQQEAAEDPGLSQTPG